MTRDEKVQVHVWLDPAIMRTVDHMCVDRGLFRAEVMETLLREGIRSRRTQVHRPERRAVSPAAAEESGE